MTISHRVAFHAFRTWAFVASIKISTKSRSSTWTSLTLVNVFTFDFRIPLISFGTFALVTTRQIYTESFSSTGSLVITFIYIDTLHDERLKKNKKNQQTNCSFILFINLLTYKSFILLIVKLIPNTIKSYWPSYRDVFTIISGWGSSVNI